MKDLTPAQTQDVLGAAGKKLTTMMVGEETKYTTLAVGEEGTVTPAGTGTSALGSF